MKILLDNKLLTATLAALHTNANYPLENLRSPFLKKIWKSTEDEDTITLTWANSIAVDCIAIGFTNADSVTAKLYNASNILLDTITVDPDEIMIYFTEVQGVRKIELEMEASTPLYVGSVGMGLAYAMLDPLSDWKPSKYNQSSKTRSADGQVQINKISPLRRIAFNFMTTDKGLFDEIEALVSNLAIPIFFDFTHLNHDFYLPYYADIEGSFEDPAKNDNQFSFSLTFLEAR